MASKESHYRRTSGLCISPIFFSLYISPLSHLIAAHNLQHQQYADDTQLFIAISPTDPTQSVTELESCLTDLYCWLSHNGLCLSPSKSDAVLFGTHQRLCTLSPISSINIAGSVISLSETVTTLGVTLDQTLNLCSHTNFANHRIITSAPCATSDPHYRMISA